MPSSDTYFQAGMPRPAGAGRKPGTPNKPRAVDPSPQAVLASNALTEMIMVFMPSVMQSLMSLQQSSDMNDRYRFLSIMARLVPYTVPRGGGLGTIDDEALQALLSYMTRVPGDDDDEREDDEVGDIIATPLGAVGHLAATAALADKTVLALGITPTPDAATKEKIDRAKRDEELYRKTNEQYMRIRAERSMRETP